MKIELTTAVEAVVEKRSNGDLLLRNKIKIGEYPANLLSWLRKNAVDFPDKPFLQERDADGSWVGISYAEALAKVNQLSNGLIALDLASNAPIAILSHNCIDMALIQFAAMQIGHPVTPISLAYSIRSQTGSLVKHILDTTAASILVMSDADLHMPKLQQWDNGGRLLFAFANSYKYEDVADFGELFADEHDLCDEAERQFTAVSPNTLAKIQFTSGSTNLPKGVEVTHGMMTSNQVTIQQLWPFLSSDDVLIDWLPWNHTFGGNFVTNMTLMHGATLHIDNGNPTPAGFEKTVANIIDVRPTIYFGVPASYAMLYARMQTDSKLRQAFFARLKFIFVAAAALDQTTYDGMRTMARTERGVDIPFFSAWGTTETAPSATLVYWMTDDIRVVGLPNPGTTLKLVADAEPNRYEVRVTGPNITKRYYHNPEATAAAFDEEGFYCTGDAVAFLDSDNPSAGILFNGRIGEDFKLTSGVWVRNNHLRSSINKFGKPFLLEVVLAAPNKPFLNGLIIPNIVALRKKFATLLADYPTEATFLKTEPVVNLFRSIFQKHNKNETGSSKRIINFAILGDPLSFDRGEITDKGYINQRAVLRNNAALIEQFYSQNLGQGILRVDDL
ncbi:MAG: AMP-binding protein [Chloroflexi bacterium]|nr:AMP-binding protein [Chloroflexota bacterium]